MKKLFILLLVALQPVVALHINEVNYNPIGDDNNREFIEVYLDTPQSLDNWTVADASSNDTLRTMQYVTSHYALIVEEGFNCSDPGWACYNAGATIGNNLNNDNDSIVLYDTARQRVASMSYDGALANNNNHTLELYDGAWYESLIVGGTPGALNSVAPNTSIPDTGGQNDTLPDNNSTNTAINDTAPTNSTIGPDDGTGNSTADDTTGSADVNGTDVGGNETSDDNVPEDPTDSVNESTNEPVCNVTLSIVPEKTLYDAGEQVKYRILLSDTSHDFVMQYWIEDLFGVIVKDPYNSSNTNERTWTPHPEQPVEAYLIKARLVTVACADDDAGNTAEAMVVVRGTPDTADDDSTAPEPASSLSIVSIAAGSDEVVKWGEAVPVKIMVYRGDTDKYAVELYIEDEVGEKVSEVTKLSLEGKFTEYALTVPVLLDPKGDNGSYTVVLSGLDIRTTDDLQVRGIAHPCPACPTCPAQKTCPNCTTCKVCQKCAECEKLYKALMKHRNIKSFYTLAKKYGPKINLYASVNASENMTLMLLSSKTRIEQPVADTDKMTFEVEPEQGNNTYLLAVLENDTIVDAQELSVAFEPGNESGTIPEADTYTSEGSRVTGSVVSDTFYESAGQKSKKLVPYFLALVFLAITGIVLWKKGAAVEHNI
jgi:hypothetical protein